MFSWKRPVAFEHLSFPICQLNDSVDELASKSLPWLLFLPHPFPDPTPSLRDPIAVIQLPCTLLSVTRISPPPSRSWRSSCQKLSRTCLLLPHFPRPPWCQPPPSLAWRLAVALTCQPPSATAHSAICVIFSKRTLSRVSALRDPSHASSGPQAWTRDLPEGEGQPPPPQHAPAQTLRGSGHVDLPPVICLTLLGPHASLRTQRSLCLESSQPSPHDQISASLSEALI